MSNAYTKITTVSELLTLAKLQLNALPNNLCPSEENEKPEFEVCYRVTFWRQILYYTNKILHESARDYIFDLRALLRYGEVSHMLFGTPPKGIPYLIFDTKAINEDALTFMNASDEETITDIRRLREFAQERLQFCAADTHTLEYALWMNVRNTCQNIGITSDNSSYITELKTLLRLVKEGELCPNTKIDLDTILATLPID